MSRFKRYLGILLKDEEKLDRWLRFYIHHRNLYGKGQGEVAQFKALISLQAVMITWLFLKTTFPWLENWMFFAFVPFLVTFKVILHWYVGHWWDTHNVYDKEADWGNVRNPIQKKVSEKLLEGEGITR